MQMLVIFGGVNVGPDLVLFAGTYPLEYVVTGAFEVGMFITRHPDRLTPYYYCKGTHTLWSSLNSLVVL